MQIVRRTAATMAVAAFAPLLVFAALQAGASLRQMAADAEAETLSRARAVDARIDAELMADDGALAVLATSRFFDNSDLQGARGRALEVVALRPAWRNVILTDVETRQEIWETRAERDGPAPARPSVLAFLDGRVAGGIGGVGGAPPDCPCVALHQPVSSSGPSRLVLTVERGVADMQQILMASVSGTEVAAVVDRDGLFIARSLDYADRVGTQATEYVRAAVARGGEGFYVGVTYEGLRNRTAYSISDLSGWSTHVASPSSAFALLDVGSLGFTALAAAMALAFAAGATWFGVQDLKTKRLAERAQVQSQKLEAIGQIAGGVAHDFNNLLAVMMACLRQLKTTATQPKEIETIEQGLAVAERGAELTQGLLSFSRSKPLEMACIDLAATIEGVRNLLVKSLGHGVTLEVCLAEDARFVRTNATQLELALLNLALNARDAMPNRGSFVISSRPSRARDQVDLVVRDTGAGMTQEVAARAVEPFFTTKPEGKGTGLGLVQVHTLATQSGGTLELNTAPGEGAEFVLRLPACTPD